MHDTCDNGNCPMEPRIAALESVNNRSSDTHREIFRRLNEVERENAVSAAQYKTITDTLAEIKATVDMLAAKPGKRWESLVGYVLSALVGAFLLWAASGMPGLK